MADVTVHEPFPISRVANRYLLYDVNTITYIRREYHICGVLIGSLPQAPQQNVFLGVPLELMPEEARLLVEKGHAYIVDDVEAHDAAFPSMPAAEREAFKEALRAQGMEASKASQRAAGDRKEKALRRVAQQNSRARSTPPPTPSTAEDPAVDDGTSLFSSSSASPSRTPTPSPTTRRAPSDTPFHITPATSHPPLPTPPRSPSLPLPAVPPSYPLFAHLHEKGYFMMPGLRFGCQYNVYPGDPLRFHSHFLAVGKGWDEDVGLLDVAGGGRLGTGVKKAYLLGGVEEGEEGEGRKDGEGRVRVFSMEWAGM